MLNRVFEVLLIDRLLKISLIDNVRVSTQNSSSLLEHQVNLTVFFYPGTYLLILVEKSFQPLTTYCLCNESRRIF